MKHGTSNSNKRQRVGTDTGSRPRTDIARRIAHKEYRTKDGEYRLGEWQSDQRTLYHLGFLEQWKIEKLESLPGWTWAAAEFPN